MARPLTLQFAGATYHLTSCGKRSRKAFFTDADRAHSRYGWIWHAYCLVANHYCH